MTATTTTPERVEVEQVEMLDEITTRLAASGLDAWFEGKTLTIKIDDRSGNMRLVKLRLTRVTNRPSRVDLVGEPE